MIDSSASMGSESCESTPEHARFGLAVLRLPDPFESSSPCHGDPSFMAGGLQARPERAAPSIRPFLVFPF
jgi:hypothetical protein